MLKRKGKYLTNDDSFAFCQNDYTFENLVKRQKYCGFVVDSLLSKIKIKRKKTATLIFCNKQKP